jgi:hypothetical protein
MIRTSGNGTRGACESEWRNAQENVDADVDGTETVNRVVDAMDALRSRRVVVPGDGGVGVNMLVRTDGGGCIAARFAAGFAAGDAGKALGLRNASGELKPVKPSAMWYGPSETSVSAELNVCGMPGDAAG